jgi:hypothetical protein
MVNQTKDADAGKTRGLKKIIDNTGHRRKPKKTKKPETRNCERYEDD